MIVDSFTFYNEYELLEFRLRLLYDIVDKFVLVEADKTFSGKDKPFLFEQQAERFAWAKDKLVHHKAHLSLTGLALTEKPAGYDPASSYFKLEYQQRNAIRDACASFDNDVILLLSDVDEMPSREAIAYVKTDEGRKKVPFVCNQKFFYYNLNCMMSTPWRGTIMTTVGFMRENSPQIFRDARNLLPAFPEGGWHLSYFGGPDFIANKIDSFAHQEFNNADIKNATRIEQCIRNGTDLFNREFTYSKLPREAFPAYFLALADADKPFFFGLD